MLWVTMSIALVGKSLACPEAQELGAQVLRGQDVERREGLVHQQGVGLDDEGAGEADALAHPAGELLGVGGLEPVKADAVDGVPRLVSALGRRYRPGLEPELDVLAHGEPRQQGEALEDHRHAGVGPVERGAPVADRPLEGAISPAMQRKSVLLPEPERPRSATISPSCNSKEMPSRTRSGLPSGDVKDLVTSETSMIVGCARSAQASQVRAHSE